MKRVYCEECRRTERIPEIADIYVCPSCGHRTSCKSPETPQADVALNDLLGCKRWHEAEIAALKGYLADEEADDSATAKSMRRNFRCKITQHERFIKALDAVTT